MAVVEVFVDEAVRGRLPAICVKSGAAADRRLVLTSDQTAPLGAVWLCVLLGPLGWLVLLLVAASRRRSTLTVRLPYAEATLEEYQRENRRFHKVIIATAAAASACFLGTLAAPSFKPADGLLLAVAVGVVGSVIAIGCHWRVNRLLVDVSLDASGRWVRLGRVHPRFAQACSDVADQPERQPRGVS